MKNCWNLSYKKVDVRSSVLKNLTPVQNEGGLSILDDPVAGKISRFEAVQNLLK